MEEVPLSGGDMTPVVRVGDTVRRGAGPWTPTIHALLRHVRAAGFTAVPEPLGMDKQARRLAAFCDAYGDIGPRAVLEAAVANLRALIAFIETSAAAGDPAQQAVLERGDVVIYERDCAYLLREARFLA